MPNPQAYRNAAYTQETEEAFGWLVAISHPSLLGDLRVTDLEGSYDDSLRCYTQAAMGETWFSVPIVVQPPGQTDDEPEGSITIPNIDQRIGEAVRAINTAATVTVMCVLRSNPDVLMADPYELMQLRNVNLDAISAKGDLAWPELSTEPYPSDWIRPSKFPAAFRATP